MANKISLTSDSAAVSLSQDEAGVVTVVETKPGVVNGVVGGLTGLLNGGATTAIGMAKTIVTGLEIGAGVGIANKTQFTQNWPVVGAPKQ